MRLLSLSCTCLCLFLAASPVLAKDKSSDKPMDHQAMMEAYAKLGTPGDPHKQLASHAGLWITKTKSWMDPDKPPMESTGACRIPCFSRVAFCNKKCTGDMMGQPFTGIGVHGYDNATKKYVTTWIDSMGTGIFSWRARAAQTAKRSPEREPSGSHGRRHEPSCGLEVCGSEYPGLRDVRL